MRIVELEINFFRGIKRLRWNPKPGMNCLIGPGDTCKTTILDAIELALSPRYASLGADTDLFEGKTSSRPVILATLVDLPEHFFSDKKYGLNLRGWSEETFNISDERAESDQYALSLKAELDPESLEWHWSIYNDRVDPDDPPRIRIQDAKEVSPSRLGAYADRELTWGRYSALSKLKPGTTVSPLLAAAMRSARTSFAESDVSAFNDPIEQVQKIGAHFSVPKRARYNPQLDIHPSLVASGAISLHDGNLPLRTLGTGSSRLLVAGLQHHTQECSVSLIDEVEHGLEPHRVMRLLRYLRSGDTTDSLSKNRPGHDVQVVDQSATTQPGVQTFITTHSPVVVRELTVDELHSVRTDSAGVTVTSISSVVEKSGDAQRHVRATPEAFLAPRIIIGEGRTECGFLRGLDDAWTGGGRSSFALNGVVAVDGTGKDSAPTLAIHLLSLGYKCSVLLDTDKAMKLVDREKVIGLGGDIFEWPGNCSIEQRIFLDVPWDTVQQLVNYAIEVVGEQRVINNLNQVGLDLENGVSAGGQRGLADNTETRRLLGEAATLKDYSWFKNITSGEKVGSIIFNCLEVVKDKPLGSTINRIRDWIDAGT